MSELGDAILAKRRNGNKHFFFCIKNAYCALEIFFESGCFEITRPFQLRDFSQKKSNFTVFMFEILKTKSINLFEDFVCRTAYVRFSSLCGGKTKKWHIPVTSLNKFIAKCASLTFKMCTFSIEWDTWRYDAKAKYNTSWKISSYWLNNISMPNQVEWKKK